MTMILTHGYFLKEDVRESKIMMPYPPLGLLYISAFLEKNGINHEVFDSTFSTFEELKDYIAHKRVTIIGFYVTFHTRSVVLKMIEYIRSLKDLSNTSIIIGGPDVRYNIEKYLHHGADYLVLGEGEVCMLELSNYLNNTSSLKLENIKGIAYKLNGAVHVNKEIDLNENLNELPFPARHKIDIQKYLQTWKENHGYSSITISTMRGCPYSCNWCSKSVFGNTHRRRSPESVVSEIAWLQNNYSFDKIWFVDDVFTISRDWLQSFSELLVKSEINISYEVISRADRLDEDIIKLLKNSGCYRLWIGAESGSQRILDAMNRKTDILKTISAIHLLKKNGIESGTFIIIAYPGETKEDINKTIHYLKTASPDLFTITIAYPIIGTLFHENIKSLITKTYDWSITSDRDIDFKRTYPRKYYNLAIGLIYNEVNAQKTKAMMLKMKFKLKVFVAETLMWLIKTFLHIK